MHHEVDDPTWEPPENFEDSDNADSDISEDEINDLIESMKTEVKITDFLHDNNIADTAVPGDNVEFNIKNVSVEDIKRGYVASDSARCRC